MWKQLQSVSPFNRRAVQNVGEICFWKFSLNHHGWIGHHVQAVVDVEVVGLAVVDVVGLAFVGRRIV